MEPDNLNAEHGLAQALLNDGQLGAALKHFEAISVADPQDAQTNTRISEIEHKQGHYEQALTTLKKAKALASDSLEISYDEALIEDSNWSTRRCCAQSLQLLVKQTTHPDGQYADAEKNNHSHLPRPAGECIPRAEQDGPGCANLPADGRHGRRMHRARVPGRSRCLSRCQAV